MYRKIWFISLLLLWGASSALAAWDPNTDPALIGWWTFDEGSGTVAKDSSSNGNDGTVNGGAQWVPGWRGTALDFDGADDYVSTGKTLLNGVTKFAITFWVKGDFSQGNRTALVGQNNCIEFGISSSNTVQIWTEVNRGSVNATWSFGVDNTWHLVAAVGDGTSLKVYFDGNLAATSNATVANYGTSTFNVNVGGGGVFDDTGNWFRGQIDDVRIFNRALTAAEVKSLVPPILKARNPEPANGATNLLPAMPMFKWVKGDTAVLHEVWFGTSPDALTKVQSNSYTFYWHVLYPLVPGTTYYWRVDEIDGNKRVYTGDLWSAMARPLVAYQPVPADGAQDVFSVASLIWTAGAGAGQHQVYLSADKAEVENGATGADKGKVDVTKFDAGTLRASTTYYWRVDEIDAFDAVQKGNVWSFTTSGTQGKALWQWWSDIGSGTAVGDLTANANYPGNPSGAQLVDAFESPADWGSNYGQRIVGWLKPPEDGDYTFWIAGDDNQELWLSTDDTPANAVLIASVPGWTPYRDFDNTGPDQAGDADLQKSDPITLKAGQKYYIEALGKEGGGGDSTSVAWQGPGVAARDVIKGKYVDTFVLLSLQAFSPSPANGDANVAQALTLTWGAGEQAQAHVVYFGEDANALAAADASSSLCQGSQTGTSFAPGNLEWNKTYYWRVDETAGAEVWKGNVWSFTTANFSLIDDFESYDDVAGTNTRIYETWLDGLTNGTTSTVGNWNAPFCEQTIVHGGKQSMPLDYNNVVQPLYAEGELEFSPTLNWTTNGVTDLSLWYCGRAPTFYAAADGTISMAGSGHDIWDQADDFRFAWKRVSGNASITVKVESVANTNTWAKAGVMIRESLDADSKFAYMIVSYGQGVSFGWRTLAAGDCGSATQAGSAYKAPYWVKLTRTGDAFTAQYSADGTTWTDMKDSTGAVVSTTINMGSASVYIGLCVTSHDTARTTTGVFRSPSTTPSLAGEWQIATIGDDPEPANAPDKLYVIVTDNAGKSKIVTNPDPAAVITTTWTEWKIPLSELSGASLNKVQRLSIGVGDRGSPTATGGGRIYIDDIRVTKP